MVHALERRRRIVDHAQGVQVTVVGRSRMTFVAGQIHDALEVAVQLAAQKQEDVAGRKIHRDVTDQPRRWGNTMYLSTFWQSSVVNEFSTIV